MNLKTAHETTPLCGHICTDAKETLKKTVKSISPLLANVYTI